jgi:hypothetical protein
MLADTYTPRPSWYLTNGRRIVGPVDTHLLLRGITQSRFPDGCLVTEGRWRAWRPLGEIRELSLLDRDPAWRADTGGVGGSPIPEEWLRKASTAGEALFFALHAAVMATRATAGLLHRAREPFIGLVTSSVHGPPGTEAELGQVISRHDAALAAARERTLVRGSATAGAAERAVARRFSACGPELAAVAMVPIFDGDTLLAMLELARADHAFRSCDVEALVMIARLVCLP